MFRGCLIFLCLGLTHVRAQPIIVSHPQPQVVPLRGTTTFWVAATGTGSLTYQWVLNTPDNPVPDATNSTLTISTAQPTNAGSYRVRITDSTGSRFSDPALLTVLPSLPDFGVIALPPAFQLDGIGSNVDSIAFWEAPEPTNSLMFVTAKASDLVEVWKYPFAGHELAPIVLTSHVNGVAVDQNTDLLYVSDRKVSVFSIPNFQLQREIGSGIIDVGENNLALLHHSSGQIYLYVSDDHRVHRFNAVSGAHLGFFEPPVSSIETMVADDFYQLILVPEEQGPAGNPGVYAYHSNGAPYLNNGTNRFGNNGEFQSDEEGILLYTFPSSGLGDDGTGFIVVADQRSTQTDFEFFDRQTWTHLGSLRLTGVSTTDGIASTQRPLPLYPLGLFAAINNDRTTAALGWHTILEAINNRAAPRVLSITPAFVGPTNAGYIDIAVVFNKPVTNFDAAADIVVNHRGTAHSGIQITGAGAQYNVRLEGISGTGFLLLTVSTNSDVRDLATNALVSSVTSRPVFFESAYQSWARDHGLTDGLNADFDDDPDNDHCSNLKEFATDRDPLSATPAGNQRISVNAEGGTNQLTYTFAVRGGAVFVSGLELSATRDGIVYALAGSDDLAQFDLPVSEIVPAHDVGLPAPHPGWSYRTFQLDTEPATTAARFMRLRIEPAPPD